MMNEKRLAEIERVYEMQDWQPEGDITLELIQALRDERSKSEWISCADRLPEDKQRVLIYYPNKRCTYNNIGDHSSVAWFIKGISEKERELMKQGKLKNLTSEGWCASQGWTKHKRSDVYSSGDVFGNNTVPYKWDGDGPMDWNGQEVTHWMPLPNKPIDQTQPK
jgi:hypothetical protein